MKKITEVGKEKFVAVLKQMNLAAIKPYTVSYNEATTALVYMIGETVVGVEIGGYYFMETGAV